MYFTIVLLLGLTVSIIVSVIMSRTIPALGWIGNSIAGVFGAWMGQKFFGNWGPSFGALHIFPLLIGAFISSFIVAVIMNYIFRSNYKRP